MSIYNKLPYYPAPSRSPNISLLNADDSPYQFWITEPGNIREWYGGYGGRIFGSKTVFLSGMRYGLSVYGVGTEFFAPKENTQVVIKNGKIHVNIPESADLATVIPRPAKNKVSDWLWMHQYSNGPNDVYDFPDGTTPQIWFEIVKTAAEGSHTDLAKLLDKCIDEHGPEAFRLFAHMPSKGEFKEMPNLIYHALCNPDLRSALVVLNRLWIGQKIVRDFTPQAVQQPLAKEAWFELLKSALGLTYRFVGTYRAKEVFNLYGFPEFGILTEESWVSWATEKGFLWELQNNLDRINCEAFTVGSGAVDPNFYYRQYICRVPAMVRDIVPRLAKSKSKFAGADMVTIMATPYLVNHVVDWTNGFVTAIDCCNLVWLTEVCDVFSSKGEAAREKIDKEKIAAALANMGSQIDFEEAAAALKYGRILSEEQIEAANKSKTRPKDARHVTSGGFLEAKGVNGHPLSGQLDEIFAYVPRGRTESDGEHPLATYAGRVESILMTYLRFWKAMGLLTKTDKTALEIFKQGWSVVFGAQVTPEYITLFKDCALMWATTVTVKFKGADPKTLITDPSVEAAVNEGSCSFLKTKGEMKAQFYFQCLTCAMSVSSTACLGCLKCHEGHQVTPKWFDEVACTCGMLSQWGNGCCKVTDEERKQHDPTYDSSMAFSSMDEIWVENLQEEAARIQKVIPEEKARKEKAAEAKKLADEEEANKVQEECDAFFGAMAKARAEKAAKTPSAPTTTTTNATPTVVAQPAQTTTEHHHGKDKHEKHKDKKDKKEKEKHKDKKDKKEKEKHKDKKK